MADWIEVSLRSIGTLLFLVVVLKLLGKKQISNLSYLEYIVGIAIGVIAAIISFDLTTNYWIGMISMFLWAFIPFLFSTISMKNKTVRDILFGKGTPLIKDGKILEDNLKKSQYTSDLLMSQLRSKNVFKAADVEFAVLEPTGALNVLLKKENQPLTPKDLKMKPAPIKEPQTVIMDGEILNEPLSTIGLSRAWLKSELEKIGVALENVYLGQVDSFGQLTVDLFDDKIQVPSPQEMPMLLATIKKCEADLEGFALETESEEARNMYEKNAAKVNDVIKKVTPYLQ